MGIPGDSGQNARPTCFPPASLYKAAGDVTPRLYCLGIKPPTIRRKCIPRAKRAYLAKRGRFPPESASPQAHFAQLGRISAVMLRFSAGCKSSRCEKYLRVDKT